MLSKTHPKSFDPIYEALLPLLDEVGEVWPDKAWRYVTARANLGKGYATICNVFREVMQTMISQGKVEKLPKAGRYRILKPNRRIS